MEVKKKENEIVWRCPSNIALIKYWGKRESQLPGNPSLSLTLSRSFTEMRFIYMPKKKKGEGVTFNFLFENTRKTIFEKKIGSTLEKAEPYLEFLKDYELNIYSANSFPHSSGIASSASSMGALALCLCSMEQELTSHISGFDSFEQKATFLSRLGSGSAARSVFGGYVLWGECKHIPGSSDEMAIPLPIPVHKNFKHLCDSILIISSGIKPVSSSAGHKLMNTNPYAEVRYQVARNHMALLLEALTSGDEEMLVKIAEDEALHLHAMFLTSSPGYMLMQPGTFEVIHSIRRFREETGLLVFFTIDAGPNVHILYPKTIQTEVHEFIKEELAPYCENSFWIDDEIGTGPVRIK